MPAEGSTVIAIESDSDVVTARQRARELAAELELSSRPTRPCWRRRSPRSPATSRPTRAAARCPSRSSEDGRGRRGIRVVASDQGPGIADVERAMQDGYTTGGGLGLGLPGARRLVDDFVLDSEPGRGTTVTLVKWSRT